MTRKKTATISGLLDANLIAFSLSQAGGIPQKYQGGLPEQAYRDGFRAAYLYVREADREMQEELEADEEE